ncbi:hypothetical protein EJ04DRAFT_558432 [Polyplosphaeria fusca]|uniref:DUF7587 domain-containing protein n=1 Tax=Polyplosphaeria fusca TaxID=682080 RepID=A0A9P4R8N6_9PLEO|nr:hypothetical protein EJ04DRAFT_558432 [Polyplosphaeria fusca]
MALTLQNPTSPSSPYSPNTTSSPPSIPPTVYRIHHTSMQTRYSFATGFHSKNQSTILNQHSPLKTFGLAHLRHQTNISSPLISVYDSRSHAEAVARHWATQKSERFLVVEIDTRHLARGPVFRAADLLSAEVKAADADWLHQGEYLVMYRIPPQAIRIETPFGRPKGEGWMAPGVVGGN